MTAPQLPPEEIAKIDATMKALRDEAFLSTLRTDPDITKCEKVAAIRLCICLLLFKEGEYAMEKVINARDHLQMLRARPRSA